MILKNLNCGKKKTVQYNFFFDNLIKMKCSSDNSFVSVDPLVVQNDYGDETHMKLRKFFWMKKLKTLSPDRLNRQIDNNLHIQIPLYFKCFGFNVMIYPTCMY